jgi:putative FmdB family regulatory protein
VPNYEYECTQCAHRFEVWQSVGEDAPPCPECKSEVKKVFHVPRVIFKGSGFYVTDLRAEKGGNGSSEGKSAGASDEKTGGATPEGSKTTDAPSGESKAAGTKSESPGGSSSGGSSSAAK